MKAEDELETGDGSELEQQFQAELPKILDVSEHDLEEALAAVDRYLCQTPFKRFQKSLLAWKGRLYLEHGRYSDAARELQAADGLQIGDDIKNFNTKFDLAEALEKSGNPHGAYAVLEAGLAEIEEPDLLLRLKERAEKVLNQMSEVPEQRK